MAARLLDRIAEPVVRRTMHHAGAGQKSGLLEREQEWLRLGAVIDHVVLGSPAQENGSLVVADGRIADRGGIEIDATVLDRRGTQEAFDQVVAWIAELRVPPLAEEIVDAVNPDQ